LLGGFRASGGVRIKALDVMVRDVVTIAPDDMVAEAVRRLAEYDVSALPVVDIDENALG
jgi:CBS domain-containing protein